MTAVAPEIPDWIARALAKALRGSPPDWVLGIAIAAAEAFEGLVATGRAEGDLVELLDDFVEAHLDERRRDIYAWAAAYTETRWFELAEAQAYEHPDWDLLRSAAERLQFVQRSAVDAIARQVWKAAASRREFTRVT